MDLVFAQSFEGLANTLGHKLDDHTSQRFREVGVDFDDLPPNLPAAVWGKTVELAAVIDAPQLSLERSLLQLGERFVAGYGQTLIGKAVLSTLRVVGPARGLERITNTLRTGNNFSKAKTQLVSPRQYEVWYNRARHHQWLQGILSAGLLAAGARQVEVKHSRFEQDGVVFRVRWS